jgi:SAM-dependent methyltransferase
VVNAAGIGGLRERLRPAPELDARVQAFLQEQLGRVLPADHARGLGWYYDWVVLGERSLEAFDVLRSRDPRPELPWLDIGSGLGTFVLLCSLRGRRAVGVEPGEQELALARERAAALPVADAAFSLGVGEDLPFEDASLGGALLHDVLEHVRDWRAVLREAHRVLAPGTPLYVKGPSYAVRFVEPHYRVPWLPLLPRPLARRYLNALGRDAGYFEHLRYRRRGEVLAELRRLGFGLEFPRLAKLRDPASVNRPWMRRLVEAVATPAGRPLRTMAERVAESPLQSTIDVVAVKGGR